MKKTLLPVVLIGIHPILSLAQSAPSHPNVIFIYADDMGRGMLSHYGQKYFSTPNIDRLFEEGTSFEYAYGCMFSAPSRASMLTGYNDCRRNKWNISQGGLLTKANTEKSLQDVERKIDEQMVNLDEGDLYLPQIFKAANYVTGQFGKLEWGFTATRKQMRAHGWDEYCGYLDHQRAHFFYPGFLYENDTILYLPQNTHPTGGRGFENESPENYKKRWDMTGKVTYSQDLFLERMLSFIRRHKDERFFLYHPTQLPHGPVAIPEVHPSIKDCKELTEIEKEYASMVLKLDEHVGILLNELEQLNLLDKTLIIYSADNGHETYYVNGNRCRKSPNRDMEGRKFDAWDYPFTSQRTGDRFDGNNGMSGKKWMNWEGSVRVPLTFSWPGHIPYGKVSQQVAANYDLLTTFADLLDVQLTTKKDGISLLPILTKKKKVLRKERYVFVASPDGPAVISSKHWKLRYNKRLKKYRLHYLPEDYKEEFILNDQYPKVLEQLKKILSPYI